MKVLALADIHLHGEGFETSQYKALMTATELLAPKNIDLVVVCGDIYDTVSTAQQRLAFKNFLDTCLTHCPVVVLRGNHDQRGDLLTFHGLKGSKGTCYVIDKNPEVVELKHLNLNIYGLPHISLPALAQNQDVKTDMTEAGRGILSDLLKTWSKDIKSSDSVSLALFHGVVAGAQLDNGYIPRANGIYVTNKQLDSLGCPVACGHYHAYQKVAKQAWYSGSPSRNSFGEAEGDKGCLVFEHNGTKWLNPEFVSLNPNKMALLTAHWLAGNKSLDEVPYKLYVSGFFTDDSILDTGTRYNGYHVRLRYHVPVDELAEATEALPRLLEHFESADELKVERIIEHNNVARCADMANTPTVVDGLKIWLEQSGRVSEDYLPLYYSTVHN